MTMSAPNTLRAFFFLTSSALTLVAQAAQIPDPASLPVSGTLVIVVPTRDGIVIAADRRTYDLARGDQDTTLKIRPIGEFTVITTTGNATWMDASTLKVAYNAKDIAQDFFRTEALPASAMHGSTSQQDAAHADPLQADLSPYLNPLARRLVDKFKEYLAGHPVAAADLQNPLFQMEIVHYDQRARQMSMYNLRILYSAAPGSPQWDVQSLSTNSGPIAFGNTRAYLELRDGHDPRFDDWRKDPALRRLLDKPLPPSRISKDDALQFCQEMIEASAQILPLIDTSMDHVGAKMDVALISKKGFAWLHRENGILSRRRASGGMQESPVPTDGLGLQ